VVTAAGATVPAAPDDRTGPRPPLLPAATLWEIALPDIPRAGGALDAARVYVPLPAAVVALDRTTGVTHWSSPVEEARSAVAAGDLLLVTGAAAVWAFEAASGTIRWRTALEPAFTAPVATPGLLIVPLAEGGLVALDAADGQEAWRQTLDGSPARSMVAGDDTVWAALEGGRLVAIAPATGDVRWSRRLDGTPGPLSRVADRLWAGTPEGTFSAVRPDTGRVLWEWALGGSVAGATAGDGLVYVAALDNLLRAFNRGNGHQRWRQALPTRPLAPPRLVGGELLVTGVDPVLATFDAETGAPIGTWTTPVLPQGSALVDPPPAPGGAAIVVVLRDGQVVGLRPQDAPAAAAEPPEAGA
jgi:outer membrane protein assembly factor BamB